MMARTWSRLNTPSPRRGVAMGICRDLEKPDCYLETFVVSSCAEHLRRHDQLTRPDSHLEDRFRNYTANKPTVRQLIYL
jgi:hypothetical protein